MDSDKIFGSFDSEIISRYDLDNNGFVKRSPEIELFTKP